MSGIEIAGLVIGTFPLLISGFEHYGKSVSALWRFHLAHKNCKHVLLYHHTLLEYNIEELLLPLVVDDDKLKRLIEDPAGKMWEDPELEERLKERLPGSYDVFLTIMIKINKLVEELKRELGVINPPFVPQVDEVSRDPVAAPA